MRKPSRILANLLPFVASVFPQAAAVVLMGRVMRSEDLPGDPVETYVGEVDGADAFIALICDGDQIAGYATDGEAISVWLAASQLDPDGHARLVQRDGPELGQVRLRGDVATGEVTLGARERAFRAELATREAGLYEASTQSDGDSCQVGWIVLPDGRQRAAMDSYVDRHVEIGPAPALADTVSIHGFADQRPRELTTAYLGAVPKAAR